MVEPFHVALGKMICNFSSFFSLFYSLLFSFSALHDDKQTSKENRRKSQFFVWVTFISSKKSYRLMFCGYVLDNFASFSFDLVISALRLKEGEVRHRL